MPTQHVLVVGIDGVRLDLLAELDTPHLDELADAGFLAPVEIDEATPTMSGPCWATIATGVTVAQARGLGQPPRRQPARRLLRRSATVRVTPGRSGRSSW